MLRIGSSPKIKSKGKLSEHPSVLALMGDALEAELAEDVIRRKCRALVAHAKSYGWSGPPYSPQELASLNGIIVQSGEYDFEGDGRIFGYQSKVYLQYKTNTSPERQRFTICHEIAHTCFPDAYTTVRNRKGEKGEGPKKFELLCDIGASELLMPLEDFTQDLAAVPLTVKAAIELGSRYQSSIEATLRRMVYISEHPCAIVFIGNPPVGSGANEVGLRCRYFCASKRFERFIQGSDIPPEGSLVHQVTKGEIDIAEERKEKWTLDGLPIEVTVGAVRIPDFGNPNYPLAIALLQHNGAT